MKRQAWAFLVAIAAGLLSVAAVIEGEWAWAGASAALALGAHRAARVWNRVAPMPFPYAFRWLLLLPRGAHSPDRLVAILEPQEGERILEVGPGLGLHALPVAASLNPGGLLAAVDVQHEMLANLRRRVARAGVANVAAIQADAHALPYPARTFDAAYLIGVLGEIHDGSAALDELRRVLKPGGRLVVGEVLVDPDYVPLRSLERTARHAGFLVERVQGPRFSYFALLRPAIVAAYLAP